MTLLIAILALAASTPEVPRTQGGRDRPHVESKRGRIPEDKRYGVIAPYRAKLIRMARCESGGRWHIATGNGFYGGLQFDAQTWHSVGGRGLPHWHDSTEQMYRAVLLIRQRGYSPWPVCGRY